MIHKYLPKKLIERKARRSVHLGKRSKTVNVRNSRANHRVTKLGSLFKNMIKFK